MSALHAALDFDEALSLLPVLDDPEAVTRLLAPDLEAGDLAARRGDTKYEPGVRAVAGFELTHRRSGETRLGAVTVSPGRVDAFPLTRDLRLPRLAQALDPQVVAPRLEPLLTLGVPGGPWQVRPVRYKPGARCVIRYETATPRGRAVLYGKMLAAGAVRQADVVSGVHQACESVRGAPYVPPVVAVWPDLDLVLQSAVDEALDLHELAGDTAVPPGMRREAFGRAGSAVAALHGCVVPGLAERTLADDLEELRAMTPAVAAVDPGLGASYADATDALERWTDEPPDPKVTSHGALRTDQMMASGGRLALIDLDTVCRSEPARDLGNLLAYLDWKATRRPALADVLSSVGAAFLEGYAGSRPSPSPHRVALYRAASLVKVAGRRFRSLTVAEWPLVPTLLERARRLAEAPPLAPTGRYSSRPD